MGKRPYKQQALSSAIMACGIFAGSSGLAVAAECEYRITNDWGQGATAAVRITNTGPDPIQGWRVNWVLETNTLTNSWNASIQGNDPFTASDLGWNAQINPGQSVEFGLQVQANGGPIETPVVGGDVCSVTDGDDGGNDDGDNGDDGGNADPDTRYECNWWGTRFPLCESQNEGWGWENQESCIGANTCTAQPDPFGIVEIIDGGDGSDDGDDNDDGGDPDDGTSGVFRVNEAGNITRNGDVFPVQCSAWFGLEGQYEPHYAENNAGGAPMELYVGNMWWTNTGRDIQQTMDEIKARGINTIRLPIAPQTLDPNDPQGIGDIRSGGVLKNHASVRQDNARQALEDFIVQADLNDLQIIVDIHGCSNYVGWRSGRLDATPPWTDASRENYAFKREDYSCGPVDDPDVTVHLYNEELWLEDLREIAAMPEQLGVDNIMAIDIFNEPWDYTWQEWSTLAEKAYQAIAEVNSDMLVMVEGVGSGTSDGVSVPHGDASSNPNWAENFYPFTDDPLDIPRERLILSPHTYGPSVFVQRQFIDQSQPECQGMEGEAAGNAGCNVVIDPARLRAGWEEHFGFLADQGYAVVVGEFGGLLDWPNGAEPRVQEIWGHVAPGQDEQWQNAAVDYFREKGIQGCYWSTNPESSDTGGLYQHAYDPVGNPGGWGHWTGFEVRKWQLLQRLWDQD